MKALFPHSRSTEQTAWILIVVLLGLMLAFCYLFLRRISRDLPQSIAPAAQTFVRVCKSPAPNSDFQFSLR